jgi:hypothetical protein
MKTRIAGFVVLLSCAALVHTVIGGDDIKSGPDKKYGGAFDVKAITGDLKGKTLCYV